MQALQIMPQDRSDFLRMPAAEVLAAILSRGSYDNLTIALTCEKCEKEATDTLAGHQAKQLRCPCGGAFDAHPLRVALRILDHGE